MFPGRLIYVAGASGAGKDCLIRYAREALGEAERVVFAHRYITRPAELGGENHVALTESEFVLRKRHGLFAMDWESHGFRYGIGVEIDAWLAEGLSVVVNGSRGYIATARQRYPDLKLVWVNAGTELLAARLRTRGRESASQIAARLQRNSRLGVEPPADALHIENDGALETAGGRLLALLSGAGALL